MDLRAVESGNGFGRLWNRLLERLDSQRLVFKVDFLEESSPSARVISLNQIFQDNQGWNGRVIFANLRGIVVQVGGTPTNTLQVFRDTGIAQYYTGEIPTPWTENVEFYLISDLPSGALIVR